MLTKEDPVQTAGGLLLYRDDADGQRLHVLPVGMALAQRADGRPDFTLLYYQEDLPQRGARWVARFTPTFPAINPAEVAARMGGPVQVEPVRVVGGDVSLTWAGFGSAPCVLYESAGGFRSEISLTREQARSLRQQLAADAETVRVRARWLYDVARAPLAAVARVDLRAAHRALRDCADADAALPYARVRELLRTLPALRPTGLAQPAGPMRFTDDALMDQVVRIVAPVLCAHIAVPDTTSMLLDDTRITLLKDGAVPEGELGIDLTRTRSWQEVWTGEWSLSAFYRAALASGVRGECFPEVLSLPPVGKVDVLIENLLPVDGRCIDRVTVKVRQRRLGSLEEALFETTFGPDSPPVVHCPMQHIAMTDFSYRYQVQVRLLDEDPTGPGFKLLPADPGFVTSRDPIVRVGTESIGRSLAFLRAQPEIFAPHSAGGVGHVEIDVAPLANGDPVAVRRIALTAAQPFRYVALPADLFPAGGLCWRAILHPPSASPGAVVTGPWQREGRLAVTVTRTDVYPREPMRIRARLLWADLPDIQCVTCQLKSGVLPSDTTAVVPDQTCEFQSGQEDERTLILWPHSIFERTEQGEPQFGYRYKIDVAGADLGYTAWRQQTSPELIMPIADDFYVTRTLAIEVRAPWSERGGPDPASRDAEILFAEVQVQLPGGEGSASQTFTFDKTSAGRGAQCKVRSRRGSERVRCDLVVLTADGRMLNFGPYDLARDQQTIEIYRVRVSDGEAPEFGARLL